MTMQAEELLGAQVTGADGKVVGTVEQVFRDDVDGTPAWARVRSGKTGRFVPLAGGQVTKNGLSVPFETQKILGGPSIDAGQHMSAAQAEELSRYYGLASIPGQGQPGQQTQQMQQQQMQTQPQQPLQSQQPAQQRQQQPMQTQATGDDWILRQEERVDVNREMFETGHVRLHKYVDVEPIEQTVHVFHEEYDVERVPITGQDRVSGSLGEAQQELILHEERIVMRKELVPVERVRLVARRVEEDRTFRDEIRRERIEIEPDQQLANSGSRRR
jgi:uncharacterized protein (TIGR02271 family)